MRISKSWVVVGSAGIAALCLFQASRGWAKPVPSKHVQTARQLSELKPAACPFPESGEKEEDCPWAGIARTLVAEDEAGRTLQLAFSQLAPDLVKSVRQDAALGTWKEFWGESINFDELAKGIIVHPAITAQLSAYFGTKPRQVGEREIVHAGLEHTYGYLLSTLKTQFGYKRARWVQGEIEAGFDLPKGLLGPSPKGGSLLRNVTYFLGNIAFRKEPIQLKRLQQGMPVVASEITGFDYSSLKPIRLEEKIAEKGIVLRTDFIPFAKPQTNTHLLVYSVLDTKTGRSVLISGFPVQASFVEGTLKPADLGEGKTIITRYNAFVEGVSGAQFAGTRLITEGNASGAHR